MFLDNRKIFHVDILVCIEHIVLLSFCKLNDLKLYINVPTIINYTAMFAILLQFEYIIIPLYDL